ncbi:MAG: tol-pal system-associated acyl-CoA thioesterase [Gammaproteobacteria bacterium]|nr:MAG: tol-pal system-associated acyl-CoA thioesterase [Gammaproteobacteria bacterium]
MPTCSTVPPINAREETTLAEGFRWKIRVYYEDTDNGGVVYYANYLKYMERARTEWLRAHGFEQDRLRSEHALLFAVAHVSVDYLLPARFNDQLVVGVNMRHCGRASLTLDQNVWRDDEELICRGETRVACIDAETLRPKAIPKILLTELRREH